MRRAAWTFPAEWQFLYVIRQGYCSRCINFSCPLNTVCTSMRDAYLARHPAMREAWEKSGYRGQ